MWDGSTLLLLFNMFLLWLERHSSQLCNFKPNVSSIWTTWAAHGVQKIRNITDRLLRPSLIFLLLESLSPGRSSPADLPLLLPQNHLLPSLTQWREKTWQPSLKKKKENTKKQHSLTSFKHVWYRLANSFSAGCRPQRSCHDSSQRRSQFDKSFIKPGREMYQHLQLSDPSSVLQVHKIRSVAFSQQHDVAL